MKMMVVAMLLSGFAVGCSGGRVDGGPEQPVTQACCTIGGTTTCSGPSVTIQWDLRYWTSNPAEDDAGPCRAGEACSAYQVTAPGTLEPLGSGTCE